MLFVCAAAMLMMCATAFAADDPLKVAMQLSTRSFTEPQTINVTIQVANASEEDLPGPVTLIDPNGNQIEEFGAPVLTVGASKVWEGTWDVTQEQLTAGKITFRLHYYIKDENGELISRNRGFSKDITYEGAVTSVDVNRTISPTTAGNGKTVKITYDVINTGTTEITDVTIVENKSISTKKGTIAKVAAGSKESYTFTVTMGKKDLTSEATITYKANGATQKVEKEAAKIAYGEMNLSAALSTDRKGGIPGDQVKLTLTLKNSGKTDYTNVTVNDPLLGEVFAKQTVPAGKTVTLEKQVVMSDTVEYQFAVTAMNANGGVVETSTDRVKLTVMSASDAVNMSIAATADRETVYELPGVVKFHVTVTNNSTMDVEDVNVSASGVTLYSFPKILAGETREFTRDIHVSMAGQYQFVASTRNLLNEKVSFDSNVIYIGYSLPTAVPTDAPIVTPPVPRMEPIPDETEFSASMKDIQEKLQLAGMILAGIAAVGIVLLLIGTIRRTSAKIHSAKAVDHLELTGPRDYNQPHEGKYEKPEEVTEEKSEE